MAAKAEALCIFTAQRAPFKEVAPARGKVERPHIICQRSRAMLMSRWMVVSSVPMCAMTLFAIFMAALPRMLIMPLSRCMPPHSVKASCNC